MLSTEELRSSLDVCVRKLSAADKFAFDLETTGLSPREDRIKGFALATESTQWYFPTVGAKSVPITLVKEKLKPILIDTGKLCIGHNLKFDLQFCRVNGIEVNCLLGDSMILAYMLDENRSGTGRLKLKGKGGLVDELFDVELEEWSESALAGSLFGKPEDEYAFDDVKWTMNCWNKLVKSLNRAPAAKKFFWEAAMPLVEVLADMELSGMAVDIEYLSYYGKSLQKAADEVEKQAAELIGRPINIGSTEALSRYLFADPDGPKLVPKFGMEKGKKGLFSTNESTLTKYSHECPLCDVILRWREHQKLLSTYVNPFIAMASKTDAKRIYCNLNQTGTVTFRLSSSSPNLQNIPRSVKENKDNIKRAFISPPGKSLIVADYGQLELRLMAHQSQDPTMLECYRTGVDIHDMTQKALGLKERTVAKNCNFGLIYGLSADGLKRTLWDKARLDKSIDECRQWRYGFFNTYPKIPLYHKKIENILQSKGYVTTITGRKRHLQELAKADFEQALRMAINFTIQGSAADLMIIAMRNIYREIKCRALKDPRWREVLMLVQVHDELVFESPIELAEETRTMVKDKLESVVKLSIPLQADPKIGKNWEEAK
jgi:DNA polymerase-1